MTAIQDLRDFFDGCDSSAAESYFFVKGSDPKSADFDSDSELELMSEMLETARTILANSDSRVIPLSEMDERKDAIVQYDLDANHWAIRDLRRVCTEAKDNFDSFEMQLDGIIAFVIVGRHDGQDYALYQQMYPVSLFKNQSLFGIRTGGRLEPVNMPMIRLTNKVDAVLFSGEMFILNHSILERNLGLHEIVLSSVNQVIEEMEALEWMPQLDQIKDRLAADLPFARKLLRAKSMVETLKFVTTAQVNAFIKGNEAAFSKIKVENQRIQLPTKLAQNQFIQLLTDSVLRSGLTHMLYVSRAKDRVEVE